MADTGTYLLIVTIGFILTLIVGQILMRAGHGFLADVFDSEDTATSTTRLLGVLFHLVALGLLALASPHQLVPSATGTIQLVVTQLGGVLLVLGVLHGLTLLLLSRLRSRRRSQVLEESMSGQYEQQRRAQRQGNRQQVIEAGGAGGGTSSQTPR